MPAMEAVGQIQPLLELKKSPSGGGPVFTMVARAGAAPGPPSEQTFDDFAAGFAASQPSPARSASCRPSTCNSHSGIIMTYSSRREVHLICIVSCRSARSPATPAELPTDTSGLSASGANLCSVGQHSMPMRYPGYSYSTCLFAAGSSELSAAAAGQGRLPPHMLGQAEEAPGWRAVCASSPAVRDSQVEQETEQTGSIGSQTAESAFAALPPRCAL